ncbi:MAG: hypothetical protein ACFFD8_00460 [Candidatus Thorarchaeota archaeon]
MSLQSALVKILATILAIALVLFLIDFFLFQAINTTAFITTVTMLFNVNPLLSWFLMIFMVVMISFIGTILFYRRRTFIQNLRTELATAERITLIELAQNLEETPAKIEFELNRMAKSKMTKLPGLLIISQGKHVYFGKLILTKIVELYAEGYSRGEVANSLQISRSELDKALDYLIEKGEIEEREEKTTRKVRPSYRRGTR